MSEQQSNTTERAETVDPHNPPNAVLRPEVRTAALWAYLGPLIVIAVVALIGLLYWANRDSDPNDDVTPTSGVSDELKPGGGDPAPKPDNAQEEVENRGR
jgi:hypothetical protein